MVSIVMVFEVIIGVVKVLMVVVIVFVIVGAKIYVIETSKCWACSLCPFSASWS